MTQSKKENPINLDIEHVTIFQNVPYLVTCDEDDTVLLAIKPTINNRFITWYDGGYERAFPIDEAFSVDNIIKLNINGKFYFFEPLTFDIYQKSVVPKLISPPEINSQEELQSYYLKHFIN